MAPLTSSCSLEMLFPREKDEAADVTDLDVAGLGVGLGFEPGIGLGLT